MIFPRLLLPWFFSAVFSLPVCAAEVLKAGVIGLDTSHATAFTALLNQPKEGAPDYGIRVVAAFPKGSADIASSVSKIPEYTAQIKSMGVNITESIPDLMKQVGGVLLETNDGRPHLAQFRECLPWKKPVFIDKPLAASLTDVLAIFREAKEAGVPVFSASALRYGKATQELRKDTMGKVLRAETTSPAALEPTHPDLFWYGIHGIESLVTLMGPGAEKVKRGVTGSGKMEVVVTWSDGRIGIWREDKGYTAKVECEKGGATAGQFDGYEPLVAEIAAFLKSGKPPVDSAETIEIYAIMEAADESKRRNGAEVTLREVLDKAAAAPVAPKAG